MIDAPAVGLATLAHVVRSKNAGPATLTLDLFFRDEAGYRRAAASSRMTASSVAALYLLPADQVRRWLLPDILAIKYAMPRLLCAGDPGDGDLYGAQQHVPMLRVML